MKVLFAATSAPGIEIFNISSDHLGTPRVIRRATDGVVVWRWDSDPFGFAAPNENPSGAGEFKFNLRFPGQYADAETGLNYNYFRDYNPKTGRYVQSDPIGLRGGMNTYAYAGSNPAMYADPTGEAFVPIMLAGGIVGGVLNVGVTAYVSNGNMTLRQGLGAFSGGFISGAIGTFAGPAGGTFALARFGAGASKSLAAKTATTALAAFGNVIGQTTQNCIDPRNASSLANAAVFGLGGGILGRAVPTQNLLTLSQASSFAPKYLPAYLAGGAAGSASASGAFTASSNLFPGEPFEF